MSALDAAWFVLKSRTFAKPSDQPGGSELMRIAPSLADFQRHNKRIGVAGLSLTPQDRYDSPTSLRQAERRELIDPQERSGDEPVDLDPELTEEEQQGEMEHALRMMRRGA